MSFLGIVVETRWILLILLAGEASAPFVVSQRRTYLPLLCFTCCMYSWFPTQAVTAETRGYSEPTGKPFKRGGAPSSLH